MFKLEIKKTFVDDAEFKFPHGLPIGSADIAACAGCTMIGNNDQETILAFFLDVRHIVVGFSEVAKGSIDGCPLDFRVALRAALMSPGICGMILVHNHPSDCTEPSGMDDDVTKRLYCACTVVGLQLIDHVIVGPTGHTYSYQSSGKMRQIALSSCDMLSDLMGGRGS